MVDDRGAVPEGRPEAGGSSHLSLMARDVQVVYSIYEDTRFPTLKRRLASRLRRRQLRHVRAVQGVSFDVYEGECVGLIGSNGSGKSSLLRAVAGLIPMHEGYVYARKEPVLLGVSAALRLDLTGRRNIYLAGTALGMSHAEIDDRIDEIVEFAGLSDFIDVPLRAYSTGMSARLRFALATSVVPDILFIDEALSVGDEQFRRRSEERMHTVLDAAGTIVLVSHTLEWITDVCSRVMWIEDGRIEMDGQPEDVVAAYSRRTDAAAPS